MVVRAARLGLQRLQQRQGTGAAAVEGGQPICRRQACQQTPFAATAAADATLGCWLPTAGVGKLCIHSIRSGAGWEGVRLRCGVRKVRQCGRRQRLSAPHP